MSKHLGNYKLPILNIWKEDAFNLYLDRQSLDDEHTAWTVKFVSNLVLPDLLFKKNVDNRIPAQRMGLKYRGMVHKKRVDNTKHDTNITVQVVYVQNTYLCTWLSISLDFFKRRQLSRL